MTAKFVGAVLTPALSAAFSAVAPLFLGMPLQSFATTYAVLIGLVVAGGAASAYWWASKYPIDDNIQNKMDLYWQTWWWLKYMFIAVATTALVIALIVARYLGFSWKWSILLAAFHSTVVTLLLWLFSYIAISNR